MTGKAPLGSQATSEDGSGWYVDGKYVPERKHNPFVRSTAGGRALSALQLPWFMARPPSGYGVIITTGRRTGKMRRKCVRAIRRDDRVYIVSIPGVQAAWLKNIRANPNVRLRIRDGTFSGIARELRDPAETQEAMTAYCGTVKRFDYATCRVHRTGRPTRSKITELLRMWFEGGTPVIVELAE